MGTIIIMIHNIVVPKRKFKWREQKNWDVDNAYYFANKKAEEIYIFQV